MGFTGTKGSMVNNRATYYLVNLNNFFIAHLGRKRNQRRYRVHAFKKASFRKNFIY
jgi:hypothetical protein